MEFVNFGNTGLKVSPLCLGCLTYGGSGTGTHPWALSEEASRPFFARALELGINFFDTADSYLGGASEEVLGRAMRDLAKREEVVIATKVFNRPHPNPNVRGLSRKAIFTGIDASLRRLGMDYVDLYQIHRWDHSTPIEETMEALHDVVKSGKVRYIGASSTFAWQLAKACYVARLNGWTPFASIQLQYNMLYREEEREVLPFCLDQGIAVMCWSPLARGFLAGNRGTEGGGTTARAKADPLAEEWFYRPDDFAIAGRLTEVARARNSTNMKVAMAWVSSHPAVTAPILGATKLEHLDDAVASLSIELTGAEIERLGELYKPRSIIDHD